jgi:hypothetical protein
VSRLPGFIIIVGPLPAVNWLCVEAGLCPAWTGPFGSAQGRLRPVPTQAGSRYNHAMRPRIAVESPPLSLMSFLMPVLVFVLMFAPACTFYGDRPARALPEATGGEGLERVFWKDMQTANWVEVERALASNYAGVTPSGTLDRSATLEQYRTWQLKDYALGDLKTELNGTTIVVTYTITLNGVTSNGTAGSQPLPTAPQHMMTVWQQQKAGWVVIAHSVSQQ